MLTRRGFLAAGGSALLLPRLVRALPQRNPFTLGIASGCPREHSLLLWTRLAPEPLLGGGMPPGDVEVDYVVASDPSLRRVLRQGRALAREAYAHSVHLKVEGLEPGREYFYRFRLGDYETAIGRSRTSDRRMDRVKLAVASCQNYESGHFAAYRDLAEWTPDAIVHVGDYIYEGGISPLGEREIEVEGERLAFQTVRQHNSAEIVSLWDYRNRHALYRSDPQLQAAHAACPWIVAMDDHEIDNNWAADTPQDPEKQTALEFQVRKLAALQAYYEHMPIELPPQLAGHAARLPMHGAWRFGPALVHLLDTRQYRSDQACGDGRKPLDCAALADPARSLLGAQQEAWLLDSLRRSDAGFNVLASQIWLAPLVYGADSAAPSVNLDSWDGYPQARQRVLDALAAGVTRPVVISGDWHCAAASRLLADPADPRSRVLGHEFAGTSISSNCPWAGAVERAQAHNPQLAYVNGRQRGYARFTVERERWTTEFRVVDNPLSPDSPLRTDREMRTADL
jgi:alkaline phosphatase D